PPHPLSLAPLLHSLLCLFLFSFSDPPPTAIYTLSLHDALPISQRRRPRRVQRRRLGLDLRLGLRRLDHARAGLHPEGRLRPHALDRKSTRLNSSHVKISYAVFCLKKKNER